MFADRNNAGFKLAEKLRENHTSNSVVLAIPHGGVEVSLPIVEILNTSFDLLILEKLRLPLNPESSFGAIAIDGSIAFNDFEKFVNHEEKLKIIEKTKQIINNYDTGDFSKAPLKGKDIIIVDDGAHHGATLQASINYCLRKKVKSITIAVPVLSTRVYDELKNRVDDIVFIYKSEQLDAISSFYNNYTKINEELYRQRLSLLMAHSLIETT